MINSLSTALHAVHRRMLTSLSVDMILLPRYVNYSSYFRGLPLKLVMARSCFKHMNSVLFAFMSISMLPATFSNAVQ